MAGAPGWQWRGTESGGWLLLEQPHPSSPPLRWGEWDRRGNAQALLYWQIRQGRPTLREATLRLPGNAWLVLNSQAGDHPLWGPADGIGWGQGHQEQTMPRVWLPAQDYASLRHIPPVDKPASLPPGAGSVLLNLLAALMVDQGLAETHYLGLYPSPALFHTLRQSFHNALPVAEGMARFSAGESKPTSHPAIRENPLAIPMTESMANPLAWEPRPFQSLLADDGVLVMIREGVRGVWLGKQRFSGKHTGAQRLWRADSAANLWEAGLVLLNQPWRPLARFDASGNLLERFAHEEAAAPPVPMDSLWEQVTLAWCCQDAAALLVPALLALEGKFTWQWDTLNTQMVALAGEDLQVQAELVRTFTHLRQNNPSAELAMMLISDVVSAVSPLLLGRAQQRMTNAPPPDDPALLEEEGLAGRHRAQINLRQALPRLLTGIVDGTALPPT